MDILMSTLIVDIMDLIVDTAVDLIHDIIALWTWLKRRLYVRLENTYRCDGFCGHDLGKG